jgi:hypothetical protein
VKGTAVVATVDAVIIGIGLLIIGVPLVLPLAILTFLGAFLPLVGATAAGIVAVLVALVDGGLRDALLVTGVIVVVQQVEGDVLQPLVLGRAVKLHPVVVLAVLTGGAVIGGLVGAFLAVPVTAVAVAIGASCGAGPVGRRERRTVAGRGAAERPERSSRGRSPAAGEGDGLLGPVAPPASRRGEHPASPDGEAHRGGAEGARRASSTVRGRWRRRRPGTSNGARPPGGEPAACLVAVRLGSASLAKS